VSKWRDGAGSQEMRLSTEMNPRGSRFIWQPFHSGKPVSVAFLAGPGGTLMPLLAGWQRLATQGRFHYAGGVLPIPEPLAKRATELARRALATVPDLLGYVSVDLLLDEGDNPANDVVIEINPRLSTSYLGLRAMSRKNLFTLMLAHAQGEELLPAWKSGSVEFAIDGQVQWHDGPAVAPPSA
ncbi:MAG TPA: ATP-grasp domain-containing protein, partial [Gemmatales bacterium]|nr:ATP-grasp domain-containing protein [Gemmatales bacterium]